MLKIALLATDFSTFTCGHQAAVAIVSALASHGSVVVANGSEIKANIKKQGVVPQIPICSRKRNGTVKNDLL